MAVVNKACREPLAVRCWVVEANGQAALTRPRGFIQAAPEAL